MKRSLKSLLLLGAVGAVASACTNPTVDPSATFTAKGVVVDQTGAPLANTEVRLIKYWSDFNTFQPSVETLFDDNPDGDDGVLGVKVVDKVNTNSEGEYEFTFTGEDISKPGGVMTGTGLVEVADVVAVARDPSDVSGKSGVYTYNKLYMTSDKVWDAGELPLWDSEAEADGSTALTDGWVKLSWSKLERSSTTMVRNAYRVWIEPATEAGPRLVIYCNQGSAVEGGCDQDTADPNKLARYVSAYSIYYYYSDTDDGEYAAFVQGNSPDYRFVSRFSIINPIPVEIEVARAPIDGFQVWAVNRTTGEDQELTDTAATDGKAETREPITVNGADAIYVKLVSNGLSPVLSDAGILNSLVNNAADGCVTLEFTEDVSNDLDGALAETMWDQKGKFCGENGARDEISALVVLTTTGQAGVAAGWMRLTVDPMLSFDEVGEVAVFRSAN
jgi:hypothetical protein